MRNAEKFSGLLLAAAISAVPGVVMSQDDPAAEVVQLNQNAMSDYQNMKISDAVAKLQEAEGICLQFSLQGHELALTYVNMGVIEAAGNQNESAASDYFTRALCFEPTILVDPLVSTPEVEKVFNAAREKSADPNTCANYAAGAIPPPPAGDFPPPADGDFPLPPDGEIPPPPPGGGFDEPIPPPPPASFGGGPPPPQSDNIRHEAFSQQEKMVPVPIYAMVKPGTPVDKVVLFYRTFGERVFQQIVMSKMDEEGYSATIGCDVLQTFNPTAVEYYMSILDEGGQMIGYAGNETQPFTVGFVDTVVGTPPSLPNSPPPQKCVEECPPWNPDCNRSGNCKQYGDTCTKNSDCCKGMTCDDNMCAEGDDDSGPYKPFFRLNVAFGTGAGYIVSETAQPDGRIAEPNFEKWIETNGGYCSQNNYSSSELRQCFEDKSGSVDIGGGIAWAKLQFRVTPMFYLTERLMLGASFRGGLPLSSEKDVMKIAPMGLLLAGYRIIGSGKDLYELTAVAGVGGGFMLHKVAYDDCAPFVMDQDHPWYGDPDNLGCHPADINDYREWVGPEFSQNGTFEQTYFKKSGFVAIELGVEQYLWVLKNFGIHLGIMFDALVPNIAINGDIQLGVAMRL